MSKYTYGYIALAAYTVVCVLIAYGMTTTVPHDEPPSQCLTRPWLDTTKGC